MTSPAQPRDRVSGLDGLRGVAALGVALYHFSVAHQNGEAFFDSAFIWGRYGVNLFFMISGFVMFMTLAKVRRPMDFVVSRFSRLFPAYWICVAVTFLAVRLPHADVHRAGWISGLVNLTMLQEFLGIESVDTSYWTLRVELVFYLGLGLLFRFGQLSRINFYLLGYIALAFLTFWFGNLKAGDPAVIAWIGDRLILPYIAYFAVGIILYKRTLDGGTRAPSDFLVLAAACLWIKHDLPWPAFALHLVFGAAIYGVATGRPGPLASKPLVFLGMVSYPFYLIHQFLGYALLDTLAAAGVGIHLSLPAALAVCLLLATCIHRFVEVPAQKAIREAWRRRIAPATPGLANGAAETDGLRQAA